MPTTDAALTTYSATTTAPAARTVRQRERLMGLILMAVLPALFWTAIIALSAPLFGFAPSIATLAYIAGGIGTFLASVCCAITSQANE